MSTPKPEIPETAFRCIHCRKVKPLGDFAKDQAGAITTWCDECRHDVARRWEIHPRELELVYCLWAYEKALQDEAENVIRNMVNIGMVPDGGQDAMARIRSHVALQHSRIPIRLRAFLEEYRTRFFADIGIELPAMEAVP